MDPRSCYKSEEVKGGECSSRDASKTSKSTAFEIKLNGFKIAESVAYKYLGVMMDKSLTYAEHIEKTLEKAS